MLRSLSWAGHNGRHLLIVGLLAGLAAPGLAGALRPWVGEMIACLLFVTGIRVGARAAFGSLTILRPALLRLLFFQVVLPLGVLSVFAGAGLMAQALPLALLLMLAAPSVTGAPNFAIMSGHDPVPGMRLLVLGTALFPLTALPMFVLLDLTGQGAWDALSLSARLMLAILGSVGLGFALRALFPHLGRSAARPVLDGLSAVLLAVVVVGLMAAVGPLLRDAPLTLAAWLGAATAVNFGLMLTTLALMQRAGYGDALATAIYAGNRNTALFLLVLPEAVSAPLMVFIGCYQIPMYLTPYVVKALGRRVRP